jgi:hypothetical protein
MTILIVRVPVEGRPQFHVDALNDGEEVRLMDWLGSSPVLIQLAHGALDLLDELLDARSDETEAA